MALAHRVSGNWLENLVLFAIWVVGSYLLTMAAWVFVPTVALGWDPTVVVSGSMAPQIRAGDVVLTEESDEILGPGTVIAFDQGSGPTIHRVVDVTSEGVYTTKGDANRTADSTAVAQENLIGRGRLLVPYIGLARVIPWAWWLGLCVLVIAAVPLWRRGSGLSIAVIVAFLGVGGLVTSFATFTDSAQASSSSVTAISLDPPTSLVASCGVVGGGVVPVGLTWSPPSTPGLTGYRVLHRPPGESVFIDVGTTGPSTTDFTHNVPQSLLNVGTHTYVVQSELSSWESDNSTTDEVSITQAAGVYSCLDL